MKKILAIMLLGILTGAGFNAAAQKNYVPSETNRQHREEFSDMRFGVFIHWGIYSMFGQGEWYLNNGKLNAEEYAKAVAAQCKSPVIYTVAEGEGSKSIDTFSKLLEVMLENGFSRKDCVVAVGGGVVGDLSGFAASAYMRGLDFYNIPTTLLSQIDSSIGGKTAINFGGVKNIVGAFYQPKGVLIDTDTLKTLNSRLLAAGLAESIKMSVTSWLLARMPAMNPKRDWVSLTRYSSVSISLVMFPLFVTPPLL